MDHEFKTIDGGSKLARLKAPKQSACIDYSIAAAEIAVMANEAGIDGSKEPSMVELARVQKASHSKALDFICAHIDERDEIDRDWLDQNVTAMDVISAATALLASRNPKPATVGNSDAGRDS